MLDASLSVRIKNPNIVYTNGDLIQGTVTLTAYQNLTLRAIQVYCRCTVVTYVTIGDHTRIVEHQHLFQKSQRVLPARRISEEFPSGRMTLGPGVYSHDFDFTLPDARLSLPESFDKGNDISGIFWHIRARVDRGSKFQRSIIAQYNFAFTPRHTMAITRPRPPITKSQKFALSICEPHSGLTNLFLKKRCVPVELGCHISYPADGITIDDDQDCQITVGVRCDTDEAICLDRLSIFLQEHTRFCSVSSHLSSERPLVSHPIIVCKTNELLNRNGTLLTYSVSPRKIRNITAGTIDLPFLHHTFTLSVSLVVSQAANPKRKQVVNFLTDLVVQSRQIHHSEELKSQTALAC